MSKKLIKIPKEEAIEKVKLQIADGDKIRLEGIEVIKSTGNQWQKQRLEDSFRVRFEQWRDFTSDTLREIFVSDEYAQNFIDHVSSKDEYVSDRWTPDAMYYIGKELIPKLDFLQILLSNFGNFQQAQIPQKEEQTRHPQAKKTPADIPDLEEVPLFSIFKRLSLPQFLLIIGMLSGLFAFGYNVHSWKIDKEKSDLLQENNRLKNDKEKLIVERDSLKASSTKTE